MTSVHLALGQTGADVASNFWRIAAGEAADADDKNRRKGALFDVRRQTARAIVIDGDDRALEGCQLLGGKRPVFDSRNVVTKGNFVMAASDSALKSPDSLQVWTNVIFPT